MIILLYLHGFLALVVFSFLAQSKTAPVGGPSLTTNHQRQPLDTETKARTFFKHGSDVPLGVVKYATRASVLASAHAEGFLVPVTVGASTLHLSIDTGSSDLVVFSSQLVQNKKTRPAEYKPSVYSSKSPAKTWAIRYADGSFASGDVYYDVVGVEGIWVMQQPIEVADNVSSSLIQSPGMDGILGLGFGVLNKVKPEKESTFFHHAKPDLEASVFAAGLKQNGQGGYDFGFINQSRYNGELTYVDVDSSKGHWSFRAGGFTIGNGEMVANSSECVIDTGASLIYLPDTLVTAYYKQIKGATKDSTYGEWTVPCNLSLPSFTTIIKEYKAVVAGDILKLGPVPNSSQCFGAIQSNMNAGVSILGHVFLRTQYVVFDYEGPRLGFATQS